MIFLKTNALERAKKLKYRKRLFLMFLKTGEESPKRPRGRQGKILLVFFSLFSFL
jgi:hypothetical protein